MEQRSWDTLSHARSPMSAAAAGAPPPAVRIAVTAAVTGLMALMRLGVFGHRVMPIAFGMALIVFMWLRDRRLLWLTASIFAVTTVVKYSVLLPIYHASGDEATFGERMFDMTLVLFDLAVIATVVHLLIGARDKLERRNAELTGTN